MNKTIEYLQQNGAMSFQAFVNAARERGENAALWLRYKHSGAIETYFENNTLMVRASDDLEPALG